MKPTNADFALWALVQMRKAPKWAKGFKLPIGANIDSAINTRANVAKRGHRHDCNTYALLTLARDNAKRRKENFTIAGYISSLFPLPNCLASPHRDVTLCRIFRGIKKGEARRVAVK